MLLLYLKAVPRFPTFAAIRRRLAGHSNKEGSLDHAYITDSVVLCVGSTVVKKEGCGRIMQKQKWNLGFHNPGGRVRDRPPPSREPPDGPGNFTQFPRSLLP